MREDDRRRTGTWLEVLLVAPDPSEGSRLRDMLESSQAPCLDVTGVTN